MPIPAPTGISTFAKTFIMLILYGIKNCNTVKKARTWLDEHKIPYTFYDYKKEGITTAKLKSWIAQIGWEPLVNKKGTTWRLLDEATKDSITNQKNAIALMLEKNSVIKRPLIEEDNKVVILGFEESAYEKLFDK